MMSDLYLVFCLTYIRQFRRAIPAAARAAAGAGTKATLALPNWAFRLIRTASWAGTLGGGPKRQM